MQFVSCISPELNGPSAATGGSVEGVKAESQHPHGAGLLVGPVRKDLKGFEKASRESGHFNS